MDSEEMRRDNAPSIQLQLFRRFDWIADALGLTIALCFLGLPAGLYIAKRVVKHRPVQLPDNAVAYTQDGDRLWLQVAQSEAEQYNGLQNQRLAGNDQGMLFVFYPAKPVTFWMKGTVEPLDLIFIADGKILSMVHSAEPCPSDKKCALIHSPFAIDQVIELKGGSIDRLQLEIGESLSIKFVE